MKHTYEMSAITLVELADGDPDIHNVPTLKEEDELERYLKGGWIVIGKAKVTVEFFTKEKIQSQCLGALKTQLQTVRAENQQRENAILDQISKLQALTYVEAA